MDLLIHTCVSSEDLSFYQWQTFEICVDGLLSVIESLFFGGGGGRGGGGGGTVAVEVLLLDDGTVADWF